MLWPDVIGLFFPNLFFIYWFERERQRERKGEREKHQFVVPLIYTLVGCFLCVSWPGDRSRSLVWMTSNQLSCPARAWFRLFLLKTSEDASWPVWLSWLPIALKAIGHPFHSRSGHGPGLQVLSLVGACTRGSRSMSLSHRCFSPSLSPSLSQ